MRKRCMWSWVKCPFWGQTDFNFRKTLNVDSENKVYKAFGPIWNKHAPSWGQKEFFSEYLIVPILFTYSALSLCKISKKSFLWILRKRCTRLWAQFGVKMPPILGPNIVFLKIQYCHF